MKVRYFVLVSFLTLQNFITLLSSNEDDIIFGVSQDFDNGQFGSKVSVNDNYLVEIHETENETLWYRVGQLSGLNIRWTNPIHFPDNGTNADISLNVRNETIVVYQVTNGALAYRIGTVSHHDILWGDPTVYDNGTSPTVDLTADGTIVEVHEVENKLFFQHGQLVNGTVNFQESTVIANGAKADLGINCLNEIIMVHYYSYNLFFTVGAVENDTVTWGDTKLLQSGIEISAAINMNSQVVLTYRTYSNEVYSVVGLLDSENKTVQWLPQRKTPIENKINFNIAVNNKASVLTHSGGITTSLIRDRKRWMEKTSGVLEKSLWELTLPGSHDAAAYSLSYFRVEDGCKTAPIFILGLFTKPYAETQNENMLEQLNNGVRYFDIRPYFWSRNEGGTDDFHIYHDNIGSRVSRILYLTRMFLESVNKELVILRFSHFCQSNFERQGPFLHDRLAQLIRKELGGYILNFDSQVQSIFKIKLADILNLGPKVLIIYDNDYALDNTKYAIGFLRYRPYFDSYSNTDNLTVMQSDQLEKLKLNYGTETRLFLLSYTLTWQLTTFSVPNVKTLQDLSENASRSLANFVDTHDDLMINVVFVDFCSEARVTDVAIISNEKRFKRV